MFQVNLTHRDIPDSTRDLQSLTSIVQRHKAQNDRQQACNERPYLHMVASLAATVTRLQASNSRRDHGL